MTADLTEWAFRLTATYDTATIVPADDLRQLRIALARKVSGALIYETAWLEWLWTNPAPNVLVLTFSSSAPTEAEAWGSAISLTQYFLAPMETAGWGHASLVSITMATIPDDDVSLRRA